MDVVEERTERSGGSWYQTVRMTALVAAVFSGIVVILLIANLVGSAVETIDISDVGKFDLRCILRPVLTVGDQ